MKKIYCIGIGGIGVSALARWYKTQGYDVFGSDMSDSALIEQLKAEGMHITIGNSTEISLIDHGFDYVVYSEAIPQDHPEILQAKKINIPTLSYPEALGEITKNYKLVSISGTHGKSTTTSLISLIFKKSDLDFTSIVGTLIAEFNGKNFYSQKNTSTQKDFFILESCEYKESFLNYHPYIAIITNIEPDHLDYYKNAQNYILAFTKFINNIIPGGYLIINRKDSLSKDLDIKRNDIHIIEVFDQYYIQDTQKYIFPQIHMQVPGEHILFDAKVAYICGKISIKDDEIIRNALESYHGIWRRMEQVGTTQHNNIVLSDYGHHPTEILLTTQALKQKYSSKHIYCIFQPHQYNRTIELLEEFKDCFTYCDTLVIPNIYQSRDTKEDMEKMPPEKFVDSLHHENVYYGNGPENTLKMINTYDKFHPNSTVFILQGAGNIDNLRYQINFKENQAPSEHVK